MVKESTVTLIGPKKDIDKLFSCLEVETIDGVDNLYVKTFEGKNKLLGYLKSKTDTRIVMLSNLENICIMEVEIFNYKLSMCMRTEKPGDFDFYTLKDVVFNKGFSEEQTSILPHIKDLPYKQRHLVTSGYINESSSVRSVISAMGNEVFKHIEGVNGFDITYVPSEDMIEIKRQIQSAIDIYVKFDELSKRNRDWNIISRKKKKEDEDDW